MKRIFSSFVFTCLFFGIGFVLSKAGVKLEDLKDPQNLFYEKESPLSFKPTNYPIQNQKFVVVIAARNNGEGARKTLQSVLNQMYENYRVVYIDDASNDGSFEHAKDLILESPKSEIVQIYQTESMQGKLASLKAVIDTCEDREIVVIVGDEDRLAHEWVLQRLNQYYANSDLWMTTGKAIQIPHFTLQEAFQEDFVRKAHSNHFHLKTFYAALFKKIEEKDLLFQDHFMPDSVDSAYMIPMLEMAERHHAHLSDVMYLICKNEIEDIALHNSAETFLENKTAYMETMQLFDEGEKL